MIKDAIATLSLWYIGTNPIQLQQLTVQTFQIMLKKIFGHIWAVWGIFWFVFSLLLFIPIIFITRYLPEPRKSVVFYYISRWWIRLFMFPVGCPLFIKGKQHFKKGENYVVVANHNAFMDAPVSCPFVPGVNKTIAKSDFMKIPIFSLVYERGSVLVDRKDDASRRRGYEQMKKVLASGWHMCLYPEGTRNKSDEPLLPFKDGAFKLAIEANKSVIPTLLFNTRKAQPHKPANTFYPTVLKMHFLPAVSPQGHTVESLRETVWHIMADYYMANK